MNRRIFHTVLGLLMLATLTGVSAQAAADIGTADLALHLEVDRHRVRIGQDSVFIIRVENRGPATARDVTFSKHVPDPLNRVAFFCVPPATQVDGEDACHVDELARGEEVTAIAVLTPISNPAEGERKFTTFASIDSSATPDPKERNNSDAVTIRIVNVDKADLVPVIPPLGGGDFCVPVGDPPRFGIAFTARNQGVQDASASVAIVEFFLVGGGIEVVDVPIPSIPAGGSVDPPPVVTPPECFGAGQDCVFTITVDATNRVNESDESNNSTRGRCIS